MYQSAGRISSPAVISLGQLRKLCSTNPPFGWSPKYLTDDLKREIGGRLQDRVMFGADYPLLSYERLVEDWRNLGYEDEVLEKVFHRNAEAFLAELGR